MKDTAESLISEIRYQYPLGQTTFGECSTEGCDNTARGSRRCVWCLTGALGDLTNQVAAFRFRKKTEEAHESGRRILAMEREE